MKLALSTLLLAALACTKRPEEKPRRTEPWLATPSASSTASAGRASGPLRFDLLHDSVVRFTLTGRRAKPSGAVPLKSGTLELFPTDLPRSRATLVFDLSRIELREDTLPTDAELSGSSPNQLARRWLELGETVPEERRNQHQHAIFELSAVEDSAGGLDLRELKQSTRVSVIGSVRLHGFRAPVRTRVELRPQAAEDGKLRLTIRSLEPVVLSLVAHEISARSASGVSEPTVTERWSDVVGKNARVEFELHARASATPPSD